jgi:hypothetical protein
MRDIEDLRRVEIAEKGHLKLSLHSCKDASSDQP